MSAAVVLIATLALTGCASKPHTPPNHLNPTKIIDVPGKVNVVKEVHHKRKAKGGDANQTEGTYVALAPKGTVVKEGNADGLPVKSKVRALTPRGAGGTAPAAAATEPAGGDDVVLPDLLVSNGWLYVTGDVPCIGTDTILVEAEGCRVLLQCETDYQRVLFLEGSRTQILNVSRRPYHDGAPSDKQLLNGEFVDAVLVNGVFDHWSDVQPITQQMIDQINGVIDPLRNEDGVP